MTVSSRGYKSASSLMRSSKTTRILQPEYITIHSHCPQQRRNYAVAAATITSDISAPPTSDPHVTQLPPVSSTSAQTGAPSPYAIQAGIILSRPPLLTRTPHSFESAYHLYQKRLNERLAIPFTRYFYFKKDTPADNDWKLKAKERAGTPARDIGTYQAYSEEGWNDEVLMGDKTATREHVVDSLLKDSVIRVNEDGSTRLLAEGDLEKELERPLDRLTLADRRKDPTRLNRMLDRTLYLVVKGNENSQWRLPSGPLLGRENLHQAAERILIQAAGMNMNTWIVGHAPVGHVVQAPKAAESTTSDEAGKVHKRELVKQGTKTFFMKGRIMAGQVDLAENAFGLTHFKWLCKEEVEKAVGTQYWSRIKGMFADR